MGHPAIGLQTRRGNYADAHDVVARENAFGIHGLRVDAVEETTTIDEGYDVEADRNFHRSRRIRFKEFYKYVWPVDGPGWAFIDSVGDGEVQLPDVAFCFVVDGCPCDQ